MNNVRKAAAQLHGDPASDTGKGLTEGYMKKQPEMYPKSVSSQNSETQLLNSRSQTLTMTLRLAERVKVQGEAAQVCLVIFIPLTFCVQRYQNLENVTTYSEL